MNSPANWIRGNDRKTSSLSAIAYTVGTSISIERLQEREGVSDEVVSSLKSVGLVNYCEDGTSIPQMCLASVKESLKQRSLDPEQIDAIVFANSRSEWSFAEETELLKTFHDAGFVRKRIVGVALQGCSACSTALSVATGLTRADGTEHVLVVVSGRVRKEVTRIGPQGGTVFSDGAASCVVSSGPGQFEILASDSLTNTYLAGLQQSPDNFMQYLEHGLEDLMEISKRVYQSSGVGPSEIEALFATNGSSTYLELMAEAAQMPVSRAYAEDVSRYGHVHSCDNLISLKSYAERTNCSAGRCYMLLAWSPYVVSASILRSNGYY